MVRLEPTSPGDALVVIEPYDPAWPQRFERERVALVTALGGLIVAGPEHIGSTAVPGLAAKPIIDILVGVADLAAASATFGRLAELGYLRWEDDPEPWRHWFLKPHPAHRTHHLQLLEPGHPQWAARLAFRDRLRTDPRTRQEYEALKRRLAEEFRTDREGYTHAKRAFVRSAVVSGEDRVDRVREAGPRR